MLFLQSLYNMRSVCMYVCMYVCISVCWCVCVYTCNKARKSIFKATMKPRPFGPRYRRHCWFWKYLFLLVLSMTLTQFVTDKKFPGRESYYPLVEQNLCTLKSAAVVVIHSWASRFKNFRKYPNPNHQIQKYNFIHFFIIVFLFIMIPQIVLIYWNLKYFLKKTCRTFMKRFL